MEPERKYYTNGQLRSESWTNEAGDWHRLDGPAFQGWRDNGRPLFQVWFINGRRHRLDGPAWQEWGTSGRLQSDTWYINGVEYKTEAEFLVAVDLYKANEIAELF